jgi:signal recognition particle subunit SRP54
MGDGKDSITICQGGVREADSTSLDVVILDTAGRLHIDAELMEELSVIKSQLSPREVLLVADGMTGQDAVSVAQTFEEKLGLSGVILTKLDGDARGGAALSIRAVTDRPIKFICLGEKLSDIEEFHPERMASRILGLGDIASLVEKAEAAFEQQEVEALEKRLRTERFTLSDFLSQLKQLKKMGPLDKMLELLPGVAPSALKGLRLDDKALVRTEAILNSMTPEEREDPKIISGSRRRRIARGSGTTVAEVNLLLKQFELSRKMMKEMMRGKRWRFPV